MSNGKALNRDLNFTFLPSAPTDRRKIATLLTCAGPAALDIYNTLDIPTDEDGNQQYDGVLTAFDDHCTPKTNETYEWYVFRNRVQKEGESFDSFLMDLRLKSKTCNYTDLRDSIIRDQIDCGINNANLRERLLRKSELTLTEAIEMCQAAEISQQQVNAFQASSATSTVSTVNTGNDRKAAKCRNFGKRHEVGNCPAIGATCSKGNKKNRYSSVCRSKSVPVPVKEDKKSSRRQRYIDKFQPEAKSVHGVETGSDSDTDTTYVGTVTCEHNDAVVQEYIIDDASFNTSASWIIPMRVSGSAGIQCRG